jgi:hypothetical protein
VAFDGKLVSIITQSAAFGWFGIINYYLLAEAFNGGGYQTRNYVTQQGYYNNMKENVFLLCGAGYDWGPRPHMSLWIPCMGNRFVVRPLSAQSNTNYFYHVRCLCIEFLDDTGSS